MYISENYSPFLTIVWFSIKTRQYNLLTKKLVNSLPQSNFLS